MATTTSTVDRVVATEYVDIQNSAEQDAPADGVRLYARTGSLFQKTNTNTTEASVGGGQDLGTANRMVRSDGTDALQVATIGVDASDNITDIGSITLSSGSTVTRVLDEDDFASNADNALATQQSIKAFVASSGAPLVIGGYTTEQRVIASDGVNNDRFGFTVSANSDASVFITGAHRSSANSPGAAYVYSGSNYATETKLTSSDGANGDFYGYCVDINSAGTIVIVGAYGNDDSFSNAGSAYIYSGASFATETKLVASDPATVANFGQSVALNGDGTIAIVGAPGLVSSTGAVYIYSGASYATETKLTASDGSTNDIFGGAVALNSAGDIAFVGAYRHGTGGAVYVYSGSNFATETKIIPTGIIAGDEFGYSVASNSDGDIIVVGAFGDNSDRGAIYVFTNSGSWTQTVKLIPKDLSTSDDFGRCVAISSDGSIVAGGADGTDDPATDAGAIYVFSGTGYETEALVQTSDFINDQEFGGGDTAVTMSADGTTLIGGAELHSTDGGTTDDGAVFIYTAVNGFITNSSNTAGVSNISISNPTSTIRGIQLGANAPTITYGLGAPTFTAIRGSLFIRLDGTTTTTRIYTNTSNGSGTSWDNLTVAS